MPWKPPSILDDLSVNATTPTNSSIYILSLLFSSPISSAMTKFFGKKRFHLSSPANLMPTFAPSSSNYNDKNTSPPPPPPSSPPCSTSSSPCGNGGFFSPQPKKRLTRQRKLRHVTVEDLCLPAEDDGHTSKSLPDSPISAHRLQQHWSLSAVPQPLPLPNDELQFPAEACNRGDRRGRSFQFGMNTTKNHSASISSKTSTYHRRKGYPQDENGSIRLDVPARSCPNTTLTSPTLSPQRFSTVDIFDSAFEFPQDLHCCQASEPSSTRRFQLHSKKSPQESPMARPLPLPPGASNSRPVSRRQSLDRSDGQSVKGQWQKGKLLGRGAYGSVYEAVNRETGSLCAMKEVDVIPDDSKSSECIRQLEQEIKVLQNLDHPNIVQYLGCETVEDRFCIYLEYVHPGPINKFVREHCGAITEPVVRNFTRHVLSGLAYLHSKKTVHRDIKGANLLVDASGVVKLADFGLAKHLSPYGNELSLKGSPHWMAPEVLQAVLRKDANPEHTFTMDIWSLGCTVIEMVTGKPPWSEFNAVQAMFNVLNRSPPIPETLSSEGKHFLAQCLQRNPEKRASAAMLLKHPFVCNAFDHSFSLCKFSGLRLKEISYNPPKDSPIRHKDSMQQSPGTAIKHGRLQFRCGTPKNVPAETSKDHSAATRHSPRSTLEVLRNVSSPEFNRSVITVEHGRTYSLPTTPSRDSYHL